MNSLTATFGEIMLRLTPPGFERFLQTSQFLATFGGGEANVAVSIAQLGGKSRFITVLPQANPIADACVGELRRFGVDTEQIVRGPGRMGLYYVEAGANQRASKVVYDRENSSIAIAEARRYRLGYGAEGRDLVPHYRDHSRNQRLGRRDGHSGDSSRPEARDSHFLRS